MKKEDMVKLISAEGFEFVIDKDAAMVSQTIYNMLTSPGSFAETQHGEVTFPEISTTILEKICKYFYWHLQFARLNRFNMKEYNAVFLMLVSYEKKAERTLIT
uniref:Elongin-C n=1 Tax=Fagus sylvatica TaxID=28930 RepID=A0A2N9G785_FAGSY